MYCIRLPASEASLFPRFLMFVKRYLMLHFMSLFDYCNAAVMNCSARKRRAINVYWSQQRAIFICLCAKLRKIDIQSNIRFKFILDFRLHTVRHRQFTSSLVHLCVMWERSKCLWWWAECLTRSAINPLMDTLKLQSNGPYTTYGDWYTGRWWVSCYI